MDEAGYLLVVKEAGFVRVSYESRWGSRSLGLIPVALWPMRLDIKPYPPRGWRIQVKRVLVRLSEPVNLLRGVHAEFDLELPVDLAISINGSHAGVLPVGRVKYAIYGTPDLGDPCRFVNNDILGELPSRLKGRVTVDLAGRFEEDYVQLNRLVIPTLGMGSYLAPGEKPVFSRVTLEVYSSSTGVVRAKSTPSVSEPGLEEVLPHQPESFYIMRFGF